MALSITGTNRQSIHSSASEAIQKDLDTLKGPHETEKSHETEKG